MSKWQLTSPGTVNGGPWVNGQATELNTITEKSTTNRKNQNLGMKYCIKLVLTVQWISRDGNVIFEPFIEILA